VSITLECCDASQWSGDADLIFTGPYAPLPECLRGKPAIISNFAHRKELCERHIGGELHEFGSGSNGLRSRIWVSNLPIIKIDLEDLIEEEFVPGRGWFPLDLPLRLLSVYGRKGMTIWDGFMGRGTVGKACQMLDMNFIGLDIDPDRVQIAREYLNI